MRDHTNKIIRVFISSIINILIIFQIMSSVRIRSFNVFSPFHRSWTMLRSVGTSSLHEQTQWTTENLYRFFFVFFYSLYQSGTFLRKRKGELERENECHISLAARLFSRVYPSYIKKKLTQDNRLLSVFYAHYPIFHSLSYVHFPLHSEHIIPFWNEADSVSKLKMFRATSTSVILKFCITNFHFCDCFHRFFGYFTWCFVTKFRTITIFFITGK